MTAERDINNEYGARGSPTIFINDKNYDIRTYGGSAENYKDAICSAFTTEPAACAEELSTAASAATGSC